MKWILLTLAAAAAVALAGAATAGATPGNDDFANAIGLGGASSGTTSGTTVDATDEPGEPGSGLGGVWYTWTAPVSGAVQFDTCADADFDTVVDVFTGGPLLASLSLVASNDDALCGPKRSLAGFRADAGTTYWIRVSGFNGSRGSFALSWLDRPYDDFAAARALSGAFGSIGDSTAGATDEPGDPDPGRLGVWYSWVAPGAGDATFETCAGAEFDTVLDVYTGASLATLTPVARNDDDCPGHLSRVTFSAAGGERYSIRVGGFGGAWGAFTLDWSFELADTTPPTIALDPQPGSNGAGWNRTDVTVLVSATDTESGVDAISCGSTGAQSAAPTTTSGATRTVVVGTAGETTVSCTARDRAGLTSDPVTHVVRLDEVAPSVSYIGNAGSYTVDTSVAIGCAAADAVPGSGLATSGCANVSGPAYGFGLGSHTFAAAATDVAGNAGSGSATFTVVVTPSTLSALTKQLVRLSDRQRALGPQAQLDPLVTSACRALESIGPQTTARQKALNISAYTTALPRLVSLGWLTADQKTTLTTLASAL
jgi:hypothetical protein